MSFQANSEGANAYNVALTEAPPTQLKHN